MKQLTSQYGYLILETLISSALLGVIVVAIIPTINFMLLRSKRAIVDTQAALVAQTGLEATYHIFLNLSDWNTYSAGTSYQLLTNLENPISPKWELAALPSGSTQMIQSKYERTITISTVSRDINTGAQLATGTIDPNNRKITTTVSWTQAGIKKQISAELLLTKVR
jgi:type II secretory pathway pseudopilin PulG